MAKLKEINKKSPQAKTSKEPKKAQQRHLRYRGEPMTRCSGRKTIGGEFRLEFSQANLLVFLYCLALAAIRNKILLHYLSILGNEYKVITSDNGYSSDLSQFHKELHSFLTIAFNKTHFAKKDKKTTQEPVWAYQSWESEDCRRGSIWNNQKTVEDEIHTIEDFHEAIANITTKPIQQGYVTHPRYWPGFVLSAFQLGNFIQTLKKPEVFAQSPNDNKPDEVELKFVLPDVVEDWIEEKVKFSGTTRIEATSAFQCELQQRIEMKTKEACDKRQELGLGFLGVEALTRITPFMRPVDLERIHNEELIQRELKQTQKQRRGAKKKARVKELKSLLSRQQESKKVRLTSVKLESHQVEMLRRAECPSRRAYELRYKKFTTDYDKAYQSWLKDKTTVFPFGTYLMRKVYKVNCMKQITEKNLNQSLAH